MKICTILLILTALFTAIPCHGEDVRMVLNINDNWLFHAGDTAGAELVTHDDRTWRKVDLPHDFQIEQAWVAPSADEKADLSDEASNVKSRLSARGFKEMGTGWYRKHLIPDTCWRGRRVIIDFEGIMLVGDVYLNGEHIGGTDYGYVGFEIDISDRLVYGRDNVIAVRADTGKPDASRWYTGGGLFRDVHIIAKDGSMHFTRHPLQITTPVVAADKALVVVRAETTCPPETRAVSFRVTVTDPHGLTIYRGEKQRPFFRKQRTNEYAVDSIEITKPLLWDCEMPYLYTIMVELLRADGTVADRVEERFGIREIEYSPEFGFKLNGKKVVLKGIANHHTLGALGAAAYPRAMEKRIQLLKDFGFNHIRTSHNPYSKSFLDLCDEYGMLVVDELYDKWLTKYAGGRREWIDLWQHDIPEFIRRDRNHPSVIMWSLGNELQTYWSLPFADWGVTPYRMQRTLLQRYDNTRPVTVAMHPRGRDITTDSLPAPLALETDIAAYNYRYAYFPGDRRRFPDMIFYQSEASAEAMGPNYFDMEPDKVVGLAYWGMIDYLGESGGWPAKGWINGVFDISLEPKPTAYFLRSIFKEDEPVVHIAVTDVKDANAGKGSDAQDTGSSTLWNGINVGTKTMVDHWNLPAGSMLTLYTYTNADEVELTINGRSLGRKTNNRADSKERNRIKWDGVAYEVGYIEAVAYNDGAATARHRVETTGSPVSLKAEVDNAEWTSDGIDLQHVRVIAVDKEGRRVPDAAARLHFSVNGPATIVGVISGDLRSDELTVGNERSLFNGTATVILRSKRQSGMVHLTISADGFEPVNMTLQPSAPTEWPVVTTETRPGTRWWWFGNAVDTADITTLMTEYASKGIGTVEITPIYGVQDNEENETEYLSPQWMNALKHTMNEGRRLDVQVDMNNGTGWPFGGKNVSIDDAASKLLLGHYYISGLNPVIDTLLTVADTKQQAVAKVERVMAFSAHDTIDITPFVTSDGVLHWEAPAGQWHIIAAFCGKTLQKVKRAAPGGEGLVLNHFDSCVVARYLDSFTTAFNDAGAGYPAYMFNDSYEVYRADYTPGFMDEFFKRRGYKLENHLPLLTDTIDSDKKRRIATDYRRTLAELIERNFTEQWTSWAHGHGSKTRSQAHGSPANLIDLYAAVDIPECESFGMSSFGIAGLRRDTLTLPNYSDLSMLKYASSAAHITGKRLTSSETLTWLTEHFRTSLSQCKPEVDLMFAAGVNRIFFHGTAYSPPDEPWPGWKFYATTDMSPTNSMWRDAGAFFDYIGRCQSFLQLGEPDNDFLLYIPIWDMWYEHEWSDDNRLTMFDINKMSERAPRFIAAVDSIYSAGYDVDYISDKYVLGLRYDGSRVATQGGTTYKAIVIPGARLMPVDVVQHLLALSRQGARVVFLDDYPTDIPGYMVTEGQRLAFNEAIAGLHGLEGKSVTSGNNYAKALSTTGAKPEAMRYAYGLRAIRRKNKQGNHYFVSGLKGGDTEGWVPLSVDARAAMLFNPMTGECGKARLRHADDRTEVYMQLASGESVILKTFLNEDINAADWAYCGMQIDTIDLGGEWDFRFIETEPCVSNVPERVKLGSWTDISDADGISETMGTACYTKHFKMSDELQFGDDYILDLGDVRESARVKVNGRNVATLFAVPYRCRIGDYLQRGDNIIEVEVTNLPANRIAAMDRRGEVWRRFKDINIVDIHYKKTDYAMWQPMESGLLGPVRVVHYKR